MDEIAKSELKAKHGGRLIEIEHMGSEFIFRYPTRGETKMFRQMGERDAEQAGENLMFQCLVHPEPAALSAFFDLYTFAPGPMFGCIAKAAGLTANIEPVSVK